VGSALRWLGAHRDRCRVAGRSRARERVAALCQNCVNGESNRVKSGPIFSALCAHLGPAIPPDTPIQSNS
jgi:hypothetical protein